MRNFKVGDIVESGDSSSHDTYKVVSLSEDGFVSWCVNQRTREERRIPVDYLLKTRGTTNEDADTQG